MISYLTSKVRRTQPAVVCIWQTPAVTRALAPGSFLKSAAADRQITKRSSAAISPAMRLDPQFLLWSTALQSRTFAHTLGWVTTNVALWRSYCVVRGREKGLGPWSSLYEAGHSARGVWLDSKFPTFVVYATRE